MEKRPIFVLLALLLASGAYADAYMWTDDDGIVHYSDRPHPNAEIIDLGPSSASRPAPTASTPSTSDDDDERKSSPRYTSLEIISPAAEETLWNIGSILTVDLDLIPALKPGHQIRVHFDGMPQIMGSTSFQITEVYRGIHTLQVEVIDATGTLLIRSLPSRFYVQQSSVR